MKKGILLILTLISINFVCGQEKDSSFVGKWISKPSSTGMISLISLNEDGSGISGPGFYRNGNVKLSEFMKSDIQNWEIKNDTLVLTTKPIPRGKNKEPKSMTLLYIIQKKSKNSFLAYYSDPDMNKMI